MKLQISKYKVTFIRYKIAVYNRAIAMVTDAIYNVVIKSAVSTTQSEPCGTMTARKLFLRMYVLVVVNKKTVSHTCCVCRRFCIILVCYWHLSVIEISTR